MPNSRNSNLVMTGELALSKIIKLFSLKNGIFQIKTQTKTYTTKILRQSSHHIIAITEVIFHCQGINNLLTQMIWLPKIN